MTFIPKIKEKVDFSYKMTLALVKNNLNEAVSK